MLSPGPGLGWLPRIWAAEGPELADCEGSIPAGANAAEDNAEESEGHGPQGEFAIGSLFSGFEYCSANASVHIPALLFKPCVRGLSINWFGGARTGPPLFWDVIPV